MRRGRPRPPSSRRWRCRRPCPATTWPRACRPRAHPLRRPPTSRSSRLGAAAAAARLHRPVVFSDDGLDDPVAPPRRSALRRRPRGRRRPERRRQTRGAGRAPRAAAGHGRRFRARHRVLELYLPYARDRRRRRGPAASAPGAAAGRSRRCSTSSSRAVSWSTHAQPAPPRRAAQEHEALHDPLTGLPNRALFRERAEQRCGRRPASRPRRVVLVDLDRFKHVNDTLGHHAGDALLQAVGARLRGALRTDDTVARLGGDEFGLVLPGVGDADEAVALLERVRRALASELVLEGVVAQRRGQLRRRALSPQHGDDVEELLRHADAAMYRSKRGTDRSSLAPARRRRRPRRGRSALQARAAPRARARRAAACTTSPRSTSRPARTVGSRRWCAGSTPSAACCARRLPAGRRAVRPHRAASPRGCCAARSTTARLDGRRRRLDRHRQRLGPQPRDRRLREQSRRCSRRRRRPPARLCLEITETALAARRRRGRRQPRAAGRAGVRVSHRRLRHRLEQPRPAAHAAGQRGQDRPGFVRDLDDDAQDRALVRSVVDLAHGLACRVIAEGVETARDRAVAARQRLRRGPGLPVEPPGPVALAAGEPRRRRPPRPRRPTCPSQPRRRPARRNPVTRRPRSLPALLAGLALAAGLAGCGTQEEAAAPAAAGVAYDEQLHDRLPDALRTRRPAGRDRCHLPAGQRLRQGRPHHHRLRARPRGGSRAGARPGRALRAHRLQRDPDGPAGGRRRRRHERHDRQRRARASRSTSSTTSRPAPRSWCSAATPPGSPTCATCAARPSRPRRRPCRSTCWPARRSLRGRPIVVKEFPDNARALVELRTGRAAAVLNDYPPAAASRPTPARAPTSSWPAPRSTSRACTASRCARPTPGCATPSSRRWAAWCARRVRRGPRPLGRRQRRRRHGQRQRRRQLLSG